jgi:methylmalonyl-CoA mutase cobalamin-binding domain/chain
MISAYKNRELLFMQNATVEKMPDSGCGRDIDLVDVATDKARTEIIRSKVNLFAALCGRRPRVLVSHSDPGGQRRVLNKLAALFSGWGFDVDIGSINQMPKQTAMMAIENDVHMICLLGNGDRIGQTASEIIDSLRRHMCDDILVVLFRDAHEADVLHQVPDRRSHPFVIRPREIGKDISTILDFLSQ